MDELLDAADHLDEALESDEASLELEQENIEQNLVEQDIFPALKLDYSIKDMDERAALVSKIIESSPRANLTPRYLEILGDYIMNALTKEERKSHQYLTENRLVTVTRRETSLEGLAEKFENGEDGIYNLMTNDKNIILTPKLEITEKDIAEVPGLRELREAIAAVELQYKAAVGKRKYALKKQLIEMRRDQYVLKSMCQPQHKAPTCAKGINKIDLYEERWVDANDEPQSHGLITLFNPLHVAAILRHFRELKMELRGQFWNDFYYLIEDLEKLMTRTLKNKEPMLWDLLQWKIEGKTNAEAQALIAEKYDIKYTPEYVSVLWSKKIPKLLSEQEKNDYLMQYYINEHPEEAVWKKCSKCGQTKLAHNRFFSKNKTSKSGFYSQCKECRNKK